MANDTLSPTNRLRRSNERGFEDFGWADNYFTFSFADYRDPDWMSFGPMRAMIENHIQPRSGFQPHSHRDVEIVTYVSSGILSHRDSFGHSAGVGAGEMQHISAGSGGMVHSEENLYGEVEHNYQMWLLPDRTGTEFAYHQKGFTPEERQGRFRLYASPDGRDDSMPMNTDAFIYAGLFRAGDEARYELPEGRGAWVQIVDGRAEGAGVTLERGDGMGITDTDRLELRFGTDTEALLFDLRMDAPLIWR